MAKKHNVEINFAKITQSTSRKNQHSKVKDPPTENQGIDLPIMPVSKKICLNDEKSDEEKDGGGIFPPNRKSNEKIDKILTKINFYLNIFGFLNFFKDSSELSRHVTKSISNSLKAKFSIYSIK